MIHTVRACTSVHVGRTYWNKGRFVVLVCQIVNRQYFVDEDEHDERNLVDVAILNFNIRDHSVDVVSNRKIVESMKEKSHNAVIIWLSFKEMQHLMEVLKKTKKCVYVFNDSLIVWKLPKKNWDSLSGNSIFKHMCLFCFIVCRLRLTWKWKEVFCWFMMRSPWWFCRDPLRDSWHTFPQGWWGFSQLNEEVALSYNSFNSCNDVCIHWLLLFLP